MYMQVLHVLHFSCVPEKVGTSHNDLSQTLYSRYKSNNRWGLGEVMVIRALHIGYVFVRT
jgi:hypothetical protein